MAEIARHSDRLRNDGRTELESRVNLLIENFAQHWPFMGVSEDFSFATLVHDNGSFLRNISQLQVFFDVSGIEGLRDFDVTVPRLLVADLGRRGM